MSMILQKEVKKCGFVVESSRQQPPQISCRKRRWMGVGYTASSSKTKEKKKQGQ
jgi:hypothetical protein